MVLHKLRANFLFKESLSGSTDNINSSNSFRIVKSNMYGILKTHRTLAGARMCLRSLHGPCIILSAICYGIEKNVTAQRSILELQRVVPNIFDFLYSVALNY